MHPSSLSITPQKTLYLVVVSNIFPAFLKLILLKHIIYMQYNSSVLSVAVWWILTNVYTCIIIIEIQNISIIPWNTLTLKVVKGSKGNWESTGRRVKRGLASWKPREESISRMKEWLCQMLIRRQITKEKTEINDRFNNMESMVTLTKIATVKWWGCKLNRSWFQKEWKKSIWG